MDVVISDLRFKIFGDFSTTSPVSQVSVKKRIDSYFFFFIFIIIQADNSKKRTIKADVSEWSVIFAPRYVNFRAKSLRSPQPAVFSPSVRSKEDSGCLGDSMFGRLVGDFLVPFVVAFKIR